MHTTRTYYEVLGLSRNASEAQIKRKYRQLVRQFHPDVAKDKETAHKVFIQINEAYEALMDPARRKAYDSILDLDAGRPPIRAPRPEPRPTYSERKTPASPSAKHIKDAQWSFLQKRFFEAASHCKDALRADPWNAQAHAILGDIYRAQGRIDKAVSSYGYALQFNPDDRETEKKLTDLIGGSVYSNRVEVPRISKQVRAVAGNVLGWSIALGMILLLASHPGKPIPWLRQIDPRALWSWNLAALIAAASATVGILLSLNGLVDHPDDELVFETGTGLSIVPTGFLLLIGSGIFFPVAAAFYLLVGLLQMSLSRSVLVVFVGVALVVGLSSLAYLPAARIQVLLFGGNVSFLAMLIGWYIGIMFKPVST